MVAKKKVIPKTAKEREFAEYVKVSHSITDPVLLILRIHLYIEYLLERHILSKLARGDRILDAGRLSFGQKLCLVSSFNYLDDSLISGLRELNRVRNECAHELHKIISISDVDRIGRPFGTRYTKIRKEHGHDVFDALSSLLAGICGALAARTHLLEEENLRKAEEKGKASSGSSNKSSDADTANVTSGVKS